MIQSERVMSDIHSPINNELQLTQLPNSQYLSSSQIQVK